MNHGYVRKCTDAEVRAVLSSKGLTIDQVRANLCRLGYSEARIEEELDVTVLIEQCLGLARTIAKKHPEFFLNDDAPEDFE